MEDGEEGRMIDLDALEALEKKATPAHLIPTEWIEADQELRNALPELIRLARIGQRVERGDSFVAICGPNKGIV